MCGSSIVIITRFVVVVKVNDYATPGPPLCIIIQYLVAGNCKPSKKDAANASPFDDVDWAFPAAASVVSHRRTISNVGGGCGCRCRRHHARFRLPTRRPRRSRSSSYSIQLPASSFAKQVSTSRDDLYTFPKCFASDAFSCQSTRDVVFPV